MKRRIAYIFILITAITHYNELLSQYERSDLSGNYLGQKEPGLKPSIFAAGIISQMEEYEFGSVFSSDGSEFYYGVNVNDKSEIRYLVRNNKQWSMPERISFCKGFSCNDPFLSPDDNRLYFISDMPIDDSTYKSDIDIWYVNREGDSWSDPINAGEMINSDKNEYYISFTEKGTMYFASNTGTTDTSKWNYDIYYSKSKDGEFQKPVKLSNSINTSGYEADVFISPDESFIIFCSSRDSGFGQGDLYISFKENETWTNAINMGEDINTEGHELCPFVTPDGKFLFYTSNEDIYWVDIGIINTLRDGKL